MLMLGRGSTALLGILTAAAACLAPRTGLAQERLTLEQAMAAALANNPSLAASRQSAAGARAEALKARAALLPRLDLSERLVRTTGPGEVFWTELSQERFSLASFAASDPNDPPALTNYATRLSLVQPLYHGGSIRRGYRARVLAREAADRRAERRRQEVLREVVAAFHRALLAERNVAVAREAMAAARRHEQTARDLLDQGMALQSDLLRAQVRSSEIQAMLLTAENQRRLAVADLNRVMGVDQSRTYALVEPPEPGADTPQDLEALLAEARSRRPDLRRLVLLEQSAGQAVAAARGRSLPQVNLVATYDRNDRDFLGSDGEYWTVMAVATLPLFDGMAARADVARARAEQNRLAALRREAEQGVELEVRRSLADLAEAKSRLAVARRAVALADRSLALVEDRYAAGMAPITEVLETEAARTRARANQARARYDVDLARTDLDLAVGRL